jgi:16S rRNA (cytosine1402-N4)-methyltransferase
MAHEHVPVLRDEVLEALRILPDATYVDCTFGRGGHARSILERLSSVGRLVALDRDPEAIAAAQALALADPRLLVCHAPFSTLGEQLRALGLEGQIAGILLDLGVSSPQLDDPARGFSFLRDGPLDARMDPGSGQGVAAWLAQATEAEIATCLKDYGEERFARRIARAICRERASRPLLTTAALAALVSAAVPTREPGQHPATRTFQALRIQVNHELLELQASLPQAIAALRPGGRLAVISFHSLEDRLVKRFLRKEASGDDYPPDLPIRAQDLHSRIALVGGPIRPGPAEVAANPRSRSACLRVAERLP